MYSAIGFSNNTYLLDNDLSGGGIPLSNVLSKGLGPVPRKMVNFNPGLIQFLSKVFLNKNVQLELTKQCLAFTSRYESDNTKYYFKQYIGRENTKTEQNFNPGLALIGLSGTEH